MAKYVALLRGISPNNSNMHGSKLSTAVQGLGFSNVRPFISSGNVLFESDIKDTAKLEAMLEQAWPTKLGFNSTTIVRSQKQLQELLTANPFDGAKHSRDTYLLVTFFKQPPSSDLKFPFYPQNREYKLLGMFTGSLCSKIDTTSGKTPNLMAWLEKQYGLGITSRTWNTVTRILQKME